MELVRKLSALFNKREKRNIALLFLMMVLGALLEMLGIGLIIPFMGIITNPDVITEQPVLRFVYDTLGFQSTGQFMIFASIGMLLVFLLKNVYLYFMYSTQFRFVYRQQATLSSRLLQAYLTKPYTFHLQRNTAELLRNATEEVKRLFNSIVKPGLMFLSELLVLLAIAILVIMVEPFVSIMAGILLGGSVWLFFKIIRKQINTLGKQQQAAHGKMIKWINQGLGAGKEVKVYGKEKLFIDNFRKNSSQYAESMRFYELMNQTPRLYIETILVAVILFSVVIILLRGQNLQDLLGVLALFAMAAFRLMPSINRMVSSLTSVKYNKSALDVIYDDMVIQRVEETEERASNQQVSAASRVRQSHDESGSKAFKDAITLQQVSYRYPNAPEFSIKEISLSIPIGQSVALVGESGAGKTTLADIMLGLLEPSQGKVWVDQQELASILPLWQQKIGYIPQSIYLSDDTIRRNVAFGLEDEAIHDQSVWDALEAAQLKGFVDTLPNQLDTYVGERGVRLSGGQRQRIGIARALYHNPEILFLDEATSSLDNETEKEIMKSIDRLRGEKTLIIIAHRLSTIQNCDIIYRFNHGKLVSEEVNERLKA